MYNLKRFSEKQLYELKKIDLIIATEQLHETHYNLEWTFSENGQLPYLL